MQWRGILQNIYFKGCKNTMRKPCIHVELIDFRVVGQRTGGAIPPAAYRLTSRKYLTPRVKGRKKNIMNKLALLNTSILTTTGTYSLTDITLDEAIRLVSDNVDNLDSAIGHQSTAEIMTTLLGADIPANRQMFVQQVGQQALVFKLNGRPQEGKILSAEEIETIGYKFQLLTRLG